jgi:hypothetical protein
MYKIVIQPDFDGATTLITVFKKKCFFYVNYWNSVERILCDSKYVSGHLDNFNSKYKVLEETSFSIIPKMELFG